jgi:hypothetical protein
MEITKLYRRNNLNFLLIPDFVEQIKPSSPFEQYFHLRTSSQAIKTQDPEEFRDILRSLKKINDPILTLIIEVKCSSDYPDYSIPRGRSVAFAFFYSSSSENIRITLGMDKAENILRMFSKIEETLSLEPVKPGILQEERSFQRRTAFLAHSFDQTGKSYAYELIKFLNLLGFEVATGEGFSPERISKKVKERLISQEVVIVIVSKNEDITWLIQEATGATFVEKPLILLVEEGIELKLGIFGDLEYIRFSVSHITTTFVPILEGFKELGYSFGSSVDFQKDVG